MGFLLLTVTDASDSASTDLHRLLSSLDRQSVEIELVLVLRGGGPPPTPVSATLRIHSLEAPLVIGLSRARNEALDYARAQGLLGGADVVAFPDDDCCYPDGLLTRVAELVDAETEIVCGPYGPALGGVDRTRFPSEAMALSPAFVMRAISSNNVFLGRRVVAAVGDFDERFGLGALYGASEDSDYLLRALSLGAKGVYSPSRVFVEHPYKTDLTGKYYTGTVAVLAKHARHSQGTIWMLARRLAFGTMLVMRREISPREYGRAVRAAGRMLLARA